MLVRILNGRSWIRQPHIKESKKMRQGNLKKRCQRTIGFEIKDFQPTWAMNPAATIYSGYIYIE
jgi:hypothetical protein